MLHVSLLGEQAITDDRDGDARARSSRAVTLVAFLVVHAGSPQVWQRHRFFEGLARALIAVSRPMFLVLDNLQWCDQETLAFITFFLGLARDTPLLVAGTLRDGSRGDDPDLEEWTVRMRATGLLTELSLGPLDAATTAQLAQAISGRPLGPADVDLLHATTGGFPLYVIEAVRGAADASGAPLQAGDLQAVLRNRFDQASAAAGEVAGLAAAVGTNFTLDLLTEASDLDADVAVGRARDDVWWLPEVMRMRAAHDEAQAAIARLLSAARMASEHGSVALLRRCERDLGTRGVRRPAPGVPPRG